MNPVRWILPGKPKTTRQLIAAAADNARIRSEVLSLLGEHVSRLQPSVLGDAKERHAWLAQRSVESAHGLRVGDRVWYRAARAPVTGTVVSMTAPHGIRVRVRLHSGEVVPLFARELRRGTPPVARVLVPKAARVPAPPAARVRMPSLASLGCRPSVAVFA